MFYKWNIPPSVYIATLVCLAFWVGVYKIYTSAFHLGPGPAIACTIASAVGLCVITLYVCLHSSS